jgi:ankyrin repeat protein
MKKLFVAIRQGEIKQVKDLLEKRPELISCTAKQPPKKDDGQSPLQVAIKSGNFLVADYLLDCGADVNFIEIESCNEWRMPVIQDAIMATIMNARFLRRTYKNGEKGWELYRTKEQFDMAFKILKRMFDLGADITSHDSYGNSCLGRAILDAKQILPTIHYQDPTRVDERPLNSELKEDLTLVFDLLLKQGADVNEVDKKLGNKSLAEFYKQQCVAQFFIK